MDYFFHYLWCFGLFSIGRSNFAVDVTIDVDTVVSVGGATKVPPVFGITAYVGFEMFADGKGQDYLRDHNIDFVGLAARMPDILPDKDAKMSLDELRAWFSGSGPTERFKTSAMYKLLKSKGIRRGGAVPLYFLVNNHCLLAEKWECAPNYTPLPLNGSTIEEKFAWWTELQQGMMTQVVGTDPEVEYVHISNEPDLHFARDGYNVTYYTEFYQAAVERLKAKFPKIQYGGPITWDPPNGPFGIKEKSTNFHTWFTFMRPFLDGTVPGGYLDFVDFHAYGNNTSPEALESALNVLNGYSWSKFDRIFKIAITESNNKIFDDALVKNHTYHYNYRTFPLVLATLALIRHPDQVITRLLFDFYSPGKICGCQLYYGTDTQEMEAFALLGHLRGGTRLLIVEDIVREGRAGILVEAVQNGRNYTVALVNVEDTPFTISLNFILTTSKATQSWAGIMDVNSLRTIPAPRFPGDTVQLPAKSILLATYVMETPHHPKKVKRYSTIYPQDSRTIMVPITGTTFEIDVDLVMPVSVLDEKYTGTLQVGALGLATNASWTIVLDCYHNGTVLTIHQVRPGILSKTALPQNWIFDPSTEYKCTVNLKAQFEDHINYPEKYTETFTAEHPRYPSVFQFCTLRIETLDPYISRHRMDVE